MPRPLASLEDQTWFHEMLHEQLTEAGWPLKRGAVAKVARRLRLNPSLVSRAWRYKLDVSTYTVKLARAALAKPPPDLQPLASRYAEERVQAVDRDE
jgi:hypothetical protein